MALRRAAAATLVSAAALLFLSVGRVDVKDGGEVSLTAAAGRLPPGVHLLADALRDVAKGPVATEGTSKGVAAQRGTASATAAGDDMPGLAREALRMRGLEASLRRAAVHERWLPRAGTHAWKLAKAKAEVRATTAQLKLDKERRRLDVERAAYDKLYRGPVGQALVAKEALAARVKEEVVAAKAMQADARKLSDKVMTDLHVKEGHFDIKQWYRSQSAFESSQESTAAVKKAQALWAKAVADQQTLRKVCSGAIGRATCLAPLAFAVLVGVVLFCAPCRALM